MAKNVELMGAVFPDCPAVMLPTHEGPLARFTDVSDSQAVAADVAQGKQFYLADGTKATGTNQGGGGGGGGGGTIKPNARLVLIDYDGSIVDSYTQSEINALSALPANPDHSGDEIPLTSQGWNWTLTEVREQLTAMPEQTVYVGQMYVPTDGKTHIVIEIEEGSPANRMTVGVRYQQSKSQGVTLDWGDGSAPVSDSSTNAQYRTHTYANTGKYDITLDVTSGAITFGGSSSNRIVQNEWNYARVRQIRIGSQVTVGGYGFYGLRGVKAITIAQGTSINTSNNHFNVIKGINALVIPNNVKTASTYMVGNSTISALSLPYGITGISANAFTQNTNLKHITLPITLLSMGNNAFSNDGSLSEISVPSGITTFGTNIFNSCEFATKITLSEGMKTVAQTLCNGCRSITKVTIPSTVESIASSAFQNCLSVGEYHLKPTTPPTIVEYSFSGIASDCVFYVPYSADHSVLEAYKTASVWSTYASRMVEEAE